MVLRRLTLSSSATIIRTWSRVRAQLCRRKKVPTRGPEIDARAKTAATRDPESPAVWTGFFYCSRLRLTPRGDGTMTTPSTDDLTNRLQGLWLPLITPFRDGELDEASLRRLVRHYAAGPVDGFILAATSGEGMSLRADELERPVTVTRSELSATGRPLPILLGLSGASTAKLLDALDETAAWPIDGYLIASPYYIRPSQRGLLAHFEALADHAAWPIALYNIPYRTSVNITNQTLLRLAGHPNIIGLKDC